MSGTGPEKRTGTREGGQKASLQCKNALCVRSVHGLIPVDSSRESPPGVLRLYMQSISMASVDDSIFGFFGSFWIGEEAACGEKDTRNDIVMDLSPGERRC